MKEYFFVECSGYGYYKCPEWVLTYWASGKRSKNRCHFCHIENIKLFKKNKYYKLNFERIKSRNNWRDKQIKFISDCLRRGETKKTIAKDLGISVYGVIEFIKKYKIFV